MGLPAVVSLLCARKVASPSRRRHHTPPPSPTTMSRFTTALAACAVLLAVASAQKPSRTAYTDPHADGGCSAGEAAVQFSFGGSACAPACNAKGVCPPDPAESRIVRLSVSAALCVFIAEGRLLRG